jgi:glucosyl-3-phosphoglycerate synthase
MYADNAAFSGLEYEANTEEAMVHGVVKDAILYAGDLLISPYRLADRFSTFVGSHEAFEPFVKSGLLQAISKTKTQDQLFETPHTVSWERVERKMPDILYDIIDAVEKEKRLYIEP